MKDLFEAYLNNAEEVQPFFARSVPSLFTEPFAAGPWNPDLVREIKEWQATLGRSVDFRGDETVIITGQQPGLFTGPLYTIYKALTTIRLARLVRERVGVPCVPIFWVAGDDHDFEEARRVAMLTKRLEPHGLEYQPKQGVDGLPLYRVPLEPSLHHLIDDAAERAMGSEFREEVVTFLHESLTASTSVADWMARLMARLFQNTELILFAPYLPAARRIAAEVLKIEIAEPLGSTRRLNEAGQRLSDLGYSPQIVKRTTQTNFFLEVSGKRRNARFENSRYDFDGAESCSVDEMLHVAETETERLSPNVALRCVVQQHLFPVAAYVAGPGEVRYWAQLRSLFVFFGEPMPVVYPRARAVLLDTKSKTLMEKFGFSLSDLQRPREDLEARVSQLDEPNPAYATLEEHVAKIRDAFGDLEKALATIDRSALAMLGKLVQRTVLELGRIQRSVIDRDIAGSELMWKQISRLQNVVAPWRKEQERIYTVFSYLFEHGWDLIPRLLDQLEVESFAVQEIEL
ncbi:MAG: bacillithiol biosynthesis cysteine-adding enzyme BshC [Candidatus Hydrogenedentes bacterium]|nr:bacillithiol biosynthesis cysteine-adding enzyme BshC [Candidatus Hydrogenedentota bacterium]